MHTQRKRGREGQRSNDATLIWALEREWRGDSEWMAKRKQIMILRTSSVCLWIPSTMIIQVKECVSLRCTRQFDLSRWPPAVPIHTHPNINQFFSVCFALHSLALIAFELTSMASIDAPIDWTLYTQRWETLWLWCGTWRLSIGARFVKNFNLFAPQ